MLPYVFEDRHHRRGPSQMNSTFTRLRNISENYDNDNEALENDGEGGYSDEEAQLPERTPLLPIFSADLDSIPVYTLAHAIRLEVTSRIDTTLTWQQLRSPQVSNFVVKPILVSLVQEKNRGVLYCLMANCLQFRQEGREHPANAGTSATRALLCELLAIRCLKEFSTRELIDALSYDFYPLQGLPSDGNAGHGNPIGEPKSSTTKPTGRASRISALEVAIRAQAKKFLSHPVVVQQLEAIWAGNIVFHSLYTEMAKRSKPIESPQYPRRSATIYDGRQASLFKLSRLRVPRYRHLLSTLSLVILLAFVLISRSPSITSLEVLFWIWSAGFMLDEIADFNENGASLYLMSLWNVFDILIFLLFVTFYIMRIIGLFISTDQDTITKWSFDILGACSVFLFPRIFSVLDHYRYFSQLIIAFRVMTVDMAALLVIILISCSGFLIAFTFSFGHTYKAAPDISYILFQLMMGYTPAAWAVWDSYNPLGKALLSVFLVISHFLIMTILITVLTESFAHISANAQEEHQFLVAVNTISLVKHEALFTYFPPFNLLAWLLRPLRHCMSYRHYVRFNRTVVKVTHAPVLFVICFYEKTILHGSIYTPDDAIENHRPSGITMTALAQSCNDASLLPSSPAMRRLHRDPIGRQQQERVLDVFRRPYRSSAASFNTQDGDVVASWMQKTIPRVPGKKGSFIPRRSRRGPLNRRREHPIKAPPQSVRSDPEGVPIKAGAHQHRLRESEPAMDTENDADSGENQSSGDEELEGMSDIGENLLEKAFSVESPDKLPRSHLSPPTEGHIMPPRPGYHSRGESSVIIPHDALVTASSSESNTSPSGSSAMPGRNGHQTPPSNVSRVPKPSTSNTQAHVSKPRPMITQMREFQSVPDLSYMFLGRHVDDTNLLSSSFTTTFAKHEGEDELNRLVLERMTSLEQSVQGMVDILRKNKRSPKRSL